MEKFEKRIRRLADLLQKLNVSEAELDKEGNLLKVKFISNPPSLFKRPNRKSKKVQINQNLTPSQPPQVVYTPDMPSEEDLLMYSTFGIEESN